MKNGKFIDSDRDISYYKDDKLHREDGPAVEFANGTKFWYKEGLIHRENGPAIEWFNGNKEWYKEGWIHREDGPAIEGNNFYIWYKKGKYHRLDGPALNLNLNKKNPIIEWYIEGLKINCSSQKEFEKYLKFKAFW